MAELREDETICAISTPIGEGGIGIVRLSGKQAIEMANRLFRPKGKRALHEVPSHTVHFGEIIDPQTSRVVDEVLTTVFWAPHSYTGEDVVEISCHGGLAATRTILNLIVREGAQLAQPGEFTKRAFLNGRMDLAQAEAVLDVIRAKTDLSLEAAVQTLSGRLSSEIHAMKDRLVRLCAHIEAYLDFPEEDIEVFSTAAMGGEEIQGLIRQTKQLLKSYRGGQILREGVLVVIVGRRNVGKSSLLNTLLDRDRAIVSEIPGTTRDTIEEMIDLQGVPVRLVDTAGVAQTHDPVERLGVERTHRYLREGDLFLFVLDGSELFSVEDEALLAKLDSKKLLPVVNKIDLPQKLEQTVLAQKISHASPIPVSTKTREGLDLLEIKLLEKIWGGRIEKPGLAITRERHRLALEKTLRALEHAWEVFQKKESLEFLAVDLREALEALAELVGEVYTEDILDVIFSEFCIGK